MLRGKGNYAMRRALDSDDEGKRKMERPKRIWKKQVEEESMKVDVGKEEVTCPSIRIVGVNQIATWLR